LISYFREVEPLVKKFIDKTQKKDSSIPMYEGRVRDFFLNFLSDKRFENLGFQSVSGVHVEEYIQEIADKGARKNHLAAVYEYLKGFFKFLYEDEEIDFSKDVMLKVTKREFEKTEKEYLEEEQRTKIKNFIELKEENIYDRLLLCLLLCSGLKIGKIEHLKKNDIFKVKDRFCLSLPQEIDRIVVPLKKDITPLLEEFFEKDKSNGSECIFRKKNTNMKKIVQHVIDLSEKVLGVPASATEYANTFRIEALGNNNEIYILSTLSLVTMKSLLEIANQIGQGMGDEETYEKQCQLIDEF